MKLATYGNAEGQQRVGIVVERDTAIVDAQSLAVEARSDIAPFQSMLSLIAAGPNALDQLKNWTAQAKAEPVSLRSVRLLAPLPTPTRLRCFSTYEKHLLQSFEQVFQRRLGKLPFNVLQALGVLRLPKRFYAVPGYYKGNHMSVSGPDDTIRWPDYCEQLDYELELAVVIGTSGRDIDRENADKHIFGYTIFNDFSSRDALMAEIGGGPSPGPAKGKDFDTGNALGPWIVTPDEMGDPRDATMRVSVNGATHGSARVGEHYHPIADMIAYASRGETLHPGEVFACGAAGNGTGLEHWRFLEPGDRVELEIERIGKLANTIGQRPSIIRAL